MMDVIFIISFGSQVACCPTPTAHNSSWRDEGPQRLTIHLRRAYDVRYDIFIYLSMCSISIFWINTNMGSFLLPLIPQKPPLRARHSSSTCHWKGAMIVQGDSKNCRGNLYDWKLKRNHFATLLFLCTIRDCVSAASSPFSLKFWRQIPVQFLPLAITSTLSTPSSYLHRDTVIYYPAKQVDILNQHLYTTQFITFPSRWSGWHLWAQLGKKGFKEQLWRHVPWHAQPAKVLLQQRSGNIWNTCLHVENGIAFHSCYHLWQMFPWLLDQTPYNVSLI